MKQHNLYDLRGKRVFIAGHNGLMGSSLVKRLSLEDVEILTATRDELDLTRQIEVEKWISKFKPEVVIIAAAKVGGIHSNANYPADFIYQNTQIASNLIHSSFLAKVEKVIMLGSSCTYPKMADQPIQESSLLDGKPEETNQWYSIAKLSGIKLGEAYRRQYGMDCISILPTNLYGPRDNFDPLNSHVIPGLLNRFLEAKRQKKDEEILWGTGTPRREFMHVDDASDAIVFLIKNYSDNEPINVGTGKEINIITLANLIAKIVGYEGEIRFDITKPDGALRKLLDSSKLEKMGWKPKIGLEQGLIETYNWYIKLN